MSPSDTITKLLTSDDFVLSELQKMQTLFTLKQVIRYDHERIHEKHTESVAEHIFAMHALIDYLLPLENPAGDWDAGRIHLMAQYHDIDEIETGDIISYKKSAADIAREQAAYGRVITDLPSSLQGAVSQYLAEYTSQETAEARFTCAVDKIEPIFHLYNQTGKATMQKNKTTEEQYNRIKDPYFTDFPIIKRFNDVVAGRFRTEDFFHTDS